MLFDRLFVLIYSGSVFILKNLYFSDKMAHFLFELWVFTLKLLVSESCRLNVFVNYFLNLNDPFNNSFDFHWSFDVNRLYLDFFFNFSASLQLLGQILDLFTQFTDSSLAFWVSLLNLLYFLPSPRNLLLTVFFLFLQLGFELLYLLVFGS